MALPEDHYHHDITWWRRTGATIMTDPTFAAPVVIKGHWIEAREIFTDASGTERVSRAIVHVDRNMSEGDYLMLGISTAVDPIAANADLIDGWGRSPIPGADVHVRRAYLG